MHFKETASILSLKYELKPIKNVNLPPKPPRPTP